MTLWLYWPGIVCILPKRVVKGVAVEAERLGVDALPLR
ncbi:Unannotated [Lentimonas sp. CC19]|nr:Unannotated [Lentimonas sp. CC10]CAA6695808.1 Unannotated [Lentimonas sp. CC19]CAA7072044.1 Unannotated [Lentimonas sp. CC11]